MERKADSQFKIKSNIFEAEMAKNIIKTRGQTMPVRTLDAGTM
jgi:hypothetical protein